MSCGTASNLADGFIRLGFNALNAVSCPHAVVAGEAPEYSSCKTLRSVDACGLCLLWVLQHTTHKDGNQHVCRDVLLYIIISYVCVIGKLSFCPSNAAFSMSSICSHHALEKLLLKFSGFLLFRGLYAEAVQLTRCHLFPLPIIAWGNFSTTASSAFFLNFYFCFSCS